MSISRVIYQVSSTIQLLVKVSKPSLHNVPHKWPILLHLVENYTPKLKITKVVWELPYPGWIKVNTDGASRDNPDRSSIGFCLRDERGDIRYAYDEEIQKVTNTEDKIIAIMEVY